MGTEGTVGSSYKFECNKCLGFLADRRMVMCKTELPPSYLCAVRECRDVLDTTPEIDYEARTGAAKVVGMDYDYNLHVFDRFPTSLRQKLGKLLDVFIRRTAVFGEQVSLSANEDCYLAYATSPDEFIFLINSLVEAGYLKKEPKGYCVTLEGFDAHQGSGLLPPATIFISSTCYDLIDCRAELVAVLQESGCDVRVSDNPENFSVTHTANSIESCLLNVKAADAAFCIIDREYGPELPEQYGLLSAMEVEVNFAVEHEIPVFFFIRKQAFEEFSAFKRNDVLLDDGESNWVEKKNPQRRRKWFEFVRNHIRLPREEGRSNWFDQFVSSVDLKRIVLRRAWEIRTGERATG